MIGMIGVGLIGYGYWGPNLARNLARLPDARLLAIADSDASRRARAGHDYPAARIEPDAAAIIDAPDISAIVIATPPAQHFSLASAALALGRHVLVEKPFAADLAAARAIVAAAQRRMTTLMVDYTFVFAPTVQALSAILRSSDLGDLIFIEGMRTNLARFDPAIGVIRDLAVHDFSILQFLLDRAPVSVSCRAPRGGHNRPEDVAFLGLDYGNGLLVHLHVNCVSPVKIRRMTIGGTGGVAVFDDIEPVEKVKVFQRGLASDAELRTGYRSGDMRVATLAQQEPLECVVSHFIGCVRKGTKPITDGVLALRVAAAAQAAEQSLGCDGRPVTVESV